MAVRCTVSLSAVTRPDRDRRPAATPRPGPRALRRPAVWASLSAGAAPPARPGAD